MTVKKNHKKFILLIILLLIIAFVIIFLLNDNKKKISTTVKQPITSTNKSNPAPVTTKSTTTSSASTSSKSNNSNPTNTQPTANTPAPISPFGNFVSNYTPNLSGSPSPNLIQSTCNTTPGATCVISFSQNGVTKSLAPEVTNSNGASYWTWHLQDIGLTVGYWNITAKATLNGKSTSTGDTLKLNVQQ